MWTLLHKLAWPPLAQQLAQLAAAADERLRSLVRERAAPEPGWPARVQDAAAGSATCWQALRGVLGRRRWQVVRTNLGQQGRLLLPLQAAAMASHPLAQDWLAPLFRHAATPKEHRALQRLGACLEARVHAPPGEAGWRLGRDRARRLEALIKQRGDRLARLELVATPDDVVLGELVRIYAKARRQLRQTPRGDGARRWVGHQARVWQLLGGAGQLEGGRLQETAAATRQLHTMLEQDAWLRFLSRPGSGVVAEVSSKDASRLARLAAAQRQLLRPCIDELAAQSFRIAPEELATLLPWESFRGGAFSCGCAVAARSV